jgi:hypothetical protein
MGKKRGPLKDTSHHYKGVLDLMIIAMGGIGVERHMNAKTMAEETDIQLWVISDWRKIASRVGALETRFDNIKGQAGGRIAYWTIVHDEAWAAAKAKELWNMDMNAYDIEHKLPRDYRYNQSTRKKAHRRNEAPPLDPNVDPRPAKRTRATQVTQTFQPVPAPTGMVFGDDGETITAGDTEFTVKMRDAGFSAKKPDVEALIEAARQYSKRDEFIQEEIHRFKRMGITLDISAITIEKDPVLEAVSNVITHVDHLNAAIARQSELIAELQDSTRGRVNTQNYNDMKDENYNLKRRIEAKDTEFGKMRERKQADEREIKTLKGEVSNLATKNLQAVAAH